MLKNHRAFFWPLKKQSLDKNCNPFVKIKVSTFPVICMMHYLVFAGDVGKLEKIFENFWIFPTFPSNISKTKNNSSNRPRLKRVHPLYSRVLQSFWYDCLGKAFKLEGKNRVFYKKSSTFSTQMKSYNNSRPQMGILTCQDTLWHHWLWNRASSCQYEKSKYVKKPSHKFISPKTTESTLLASFIKKNCNPFVNTPFFAIRVQINWKLHGSIALTKPRGLIPFIWTICRPAGQKVDFLICLVWRCD